MHRPELLVLDEPTLGLDPLMQREFQRLLIESADAGSTVLLSSHVLAEVEQVCDRMGLIRAGRLQRVGSLEQLRDVRVHRVEAIVETPVTAGGSGRAVRAAGRHRLGTRRRSGALLRSWPGGSASRLAGGPRRGRARQP